MARWGQGLGSRSRRLGLRIGPIHAILIRLGWDHRLRHRVVREASSSAAGVVLVLLRDCWFLSFCASAMSAPRWRAVAALGRVWRLHSKELDSESRSLLAKALLASKRELLPHLVPSASEGQDLLCMLEVLGSCTGHM